ncbi:hypothetical protein BVG79_00181 [Ketogulonicigenium robustum]|uniref:Lon N-terminal domain-containing protein n=1 Tax=Ketogulonicigenium robustum TaxID=92947 RepID=A0A1W6NWF7_9RHOB|nr:LON peptidase substrate-binding domain-containing protein [Ketogulonicigenium robustum]ARO13541.1 hypothetical protein BVG79_00181 [Ketogulonicigenium robustum]
MATASPDRLPAQLPGRIPLFPLAGALLLPRAHLPLHIFEPRYLAMFEEALMTESRLIGMVQPLHAHDGARLHRIGCAGRIVGFGERPDGRLDVTLAGISRFRLLSEPLTATPWRQGEVGWDDFATDRNRAPETDPHLDRAALFALLARFSQARGQQHDWQSLRPLPDEALINMLSIVAPLSPADRQALLEAPDLSLRRETLCALLEFALQRPADGDPDDSEVMQ